MSKIKIIYIDKDRWEQEIDLFYVANDINEDQCHDFICYKNVVNLEHDTENATICTLNNLVSNINSKITARHNTAVIIGFDINLEYTFLNLLQIAENKKIDIYILDKSKFPIRSNVTMTIDLNEYDTKTDFNKIQNILEQNLIDSLENAKKSKKPQHATDLGISLEQEKDNSTLSKFFSSIGLDDILGEYEIITEEDDDNEEANTEDIDNFIKSLFEESYNKQENEDVNIGLKCLDGIYEISDEYNTVRMNKKSAKALYKMLEVLLYD